jgi:uncharacterized protein (TIGR02996 family)
MNEEETFLRAICEQPDEDTPRLVFADWLTEQGGAVNTAWASGIRAQVWMARGIRGLRPASALIFDFAYGREKLRQRLSLPAAVTNNWHRGFPTTAVGSFRELCEAWPQVAFRAPIQDLHINEANEAGAAEFVTWPALSVLRKLEFNTTWESAIPPNVLPALADCAALRGLKALVLRHALFFEATVEALLDSPHLAGLDKLRLGIDQHTPVLSRTLKDRLITRFGQKVFDDSIPF